MYNNPGNSSSAPPPWSRSNEPSFSQHHRQDNPTSGTSQGPPYGSSQGFAQSPPYTSQYGPHGRQMPHSSSGFHPSPLSREVKYEDQYDHMSMQAPTSAQKPQAPVTPAIPPQYPGSIISAPDARGTHDERDLLHFSEPVREAVLKPQTQTPPPQLYTQQPQHAPSPNPVIQRVVRDASTGSSAPTRSTPTLASTHATSSLEPPSPVQTPMTRRSGGSDPINLAEELEAMQLTSFYVRPGFATKGRSLTVQSNYFAVRATGDRGKIIHHYDVDINPVVRVTNQKKPRTLLRAVWEQLSLEQEGPWEAAFAACAFDGRKNCFTPVKFPIGDGETAVLQTALNPSGEIQRPKKERDESSSDDEFRRFKVSIKLVALIDLESVMEFCRADKHTPHSEEACLTGVMATNVLLRDVPSKKYVQVGATGNKFYTLEGARPIPQGGVVCKGFMQSFRYSNSGFPLLNLDLGFSAFLCSGPCLEVVAKILGSGPSGMRGRPPPGAGGPRGDLDQLSQQQISILKRKLRGAKFTVTHRQSTRLHTVVSVTLKSAEDVIFTIEGSNGKESRPISVAQYYKEYYSVPVHKPRLPCIQYGRRAYIPLEFVHLVDFNSLPPTNLTAEQTAEMIKISAMRPDLRAKTIRDWRVDLAYEKQSKIAAWGLQVNTKMVEINARVLPPPTVNYRRRSANVRDGGWQMRGHQFMRDANRPLTNWAVVSFDRFCDVDDMKRWITFLVQRLRNLGVNVANTSPPLIPPVDPRFPAGVLAGLQQAARQAFMVNKQAPQLICCILPGRDAWLYETIKKLSFTELKAPVATQCMQAAKIKNTRGIDAYTDNLAMKIVAKLGGISHQVAVSDLLGVVPGKTMILGADLGHPPFRPNSDVPTVACSIATYNADCDAYSAQIRLQPGRSEIIVNLPDMVKAHLEIFAKHNDGEYPERILMFRDGISEGQYAAAVQYEHDAIVSACRSIRSDYRPRILVCVCAKRHTTRFFSPNGSNTDRSGNLPAGLVVDRTVTHPYAFDFFLQAHAGLVGTARPTHYICLVDELAITPDQLQQLVYSLCFSFARCTRSVSLVPVCYMADLVCQKARLIVQRSDDSMVSPSETSGSRTKPPAPSTTGGFAPSTQFAERVNVQQVQQLLAKNEELASVAWWM